MTSITQRNAKALVERNGTTLPETVASGNKAVAKGKGRTPKAVAQGNEAKAVAPSNEAPKATPTPVSCHCGCGTEAKLGRRYLPGHDARHAGQVGRMVAEGKDGAQEALAALPPALKAKAERFAANRQAEADRKRLAAEIRAAAKAELAAKLAAL